jgi:hypothetical protein
MLPANVLLTRGGIGRNELLNVKPDDFGRRAFK